MAQHRLWQSRIAIIFFAGWRKTYGLNSTWNIGIECHLTGSNCDSFRAKFFDITVFIPESVCEEFLLKFSFGIRFFISYSSIISYHIIPYYIISYHIISSSYHIIPYQIISYHFISYHLISYHIIIIIILFSLSLSLSFSFLPSLSLPLSLSLSVFFLFFPRAFAKGSF